MIASTTLNMSSLLFKPRLFFLALASVCVLWFNWPRHPDSKVWSWRHDIPPSVPSSDQTHSPQPFNPPKIPIAEPSYLPKPSIPLPPSETEPNEPVQLLATMAETSQYFIDYPLPPSAFGEMGKRVQILRSWIQSTEVLQNQMSKAQREGLVEHIEKATLSLFPFLHKPSQTKNSHALHNLRQSFQPRSKGIVIPTGIGTFRFACHLIANLKQVLNSTLPIQVMHAGDADLPSQYREFIMELGADIEILDVTTVFDDETLSLASGGWAVKSFAALASKFEQVVLLDADAVFLQPPEVVFDHHVGYNDSGALLFHDRLLWQNAFKERHDWWEQHLKHHTPSSTLAKSLVYNEKYAEECDSGMVVLDKGRLSILLGALHVCWQNTRAVREAHTYIMGHGDKESWWFGMELSDANYTFENHYGSIVGAVKVDAADGKTKVCGFTIAHVDEDDRLLWYNGSLLKNKHVNPTEFDVPTHWMKDGVWEKGAAKADMSCMKDTDVLDLTTQEMDIVRKSGEAARAIDAKLKNIFKDIF